MRVCAETIYQAVYVLDWEISSAPGCESFARDALGVRPQRRLDQRMTRFIEPMTMISERPVEVAERVAPGHWEGDLITGRKNRSAIGTLVERTTRYVKLLHLPDGHTAEQVKHGAGERRAIPP